MTHLIWLSQPACMMNDLNMLDLAIRCQEESKDDVKILVCDSTMKPCSTSNIIDDAICTWCKFYRKKLIKQLPGEIEILYTSDFYLPENKFIVDALKFDYTTVDDIKKLTYKNVKIGYAVFSSYVSQTRNIYPDINYKFVEYFNMFLKASCILVELLANVLDKVNPDLVSLYFPRLYENRVLRELSNTLGYNVKCYDTRNVIKDQLNYRLNYAFVENQLNSHMATYWDLINRTWNEASLSEEEKQIVASSFFIKKRTSQRAGGDIFTQDQEYGVLPNGFNRFKRNIAIFLSSEDELVSINEEYDNNKLFSTQYNGIIEILEHFKEDTNFHFYIRIHPNLKNVKYKYHVSLLGIDELYKNSTIIRANDKISSYSLLDSVEKVLVFGSTVGAEATYWEKPVILLTNAIYQYSNIGYRPRSVEEAIMLIQADNLPLKDKSDALKYGFFYFYDQRHRYYRIDSSFKIKKVNLLNKRRDFRIYNHKSVRYCEFSLSILRMILKILAKLNLRNVIFLPIEENLSQAN